MGAFPVDPERIRGAWLGRISGCQLGKAVELLSMRQGLDGLTDYLERAGALPLRDYVPLLENTLVAAIGRSLVQGRDHPQRARRRHQLHRDRAGPDGRARTGPLHRRGGPRLATPASRRRHLHRRESRVSHAARARRGRVQLRPAAGIRSRGMRRQRVVRVDRCADPSRPLRVGVSRAPRVGRRSRTTRCCALPPGRGRPRCRVRRRPRRRDSDFESLSEAIDAARAEIPDGSGAAEAIAFGRSLVGRRDAVDRLHERYGALSPVHTLNNLALVVWGLLAGEDDYSAAVGDAVAAGWDTDCNGATIGGLWGLTGRPIPAHWTDPWQGRVAVTLAGMAELSLDDLVERTVAVAERLSESRR